jgi:hypothetical protein
MGIVSALREKPRIGGVVATCLVLVAGVVIFLEIRPARPGADTGVYFTVDDGKTWFADDPANCPPYDHNGHQAVRCMVFNAGGSDFAGFLKKYTDDVKEKMAANIPCSNDELNKGTLVKRPGDANWVPLSDPASQQIVDVKDPNHPNTAVGPVLP